MPRRTRIALAVAAGLASALYVAWVQWRVPGPGRDFDPIWVAARALFAHQDPYRAVAEWGWRFPLYHPLPALLVAMPFAILPLAAARVAFAGASGTLLGFAACGSAWWPLLFLLSAPYRHAMMELQWSPILTAATLLPAVAGLLAVKPSIGLALFLSRPTVSAVVGGIALVLVSLAVWPAWPVAWWHEARKLTHLAPVVRPGGALLLLGLLRRKRPEGRFLAALALIPHRPVGYDMLPLLVLVPERVVEMLVLMLGSEIAFRLASALPGSMQIDAYDAASWPAYLSLVYIPALIIVLLRPRTVTAEPGPTPTER
jgi:hypothetical protein